jgi:hypothetical protein
MTETEKLAAEFVAVLAEWLTPEEFAEMQRRNVTATDLDCASHDFCDANMAMDAAFSRALGREPDVMDRDDGAEGPDVALWNAAWSTAKPHLTARA